MNILGNLFNQQPQNFIGFNPQQMIMQMLQQNPVLRQNPAKAKEMVIEKFKTGNIGRDEFEKFSYMAKQLGVNDEILNELNQYIK